MATQPKNTIQGKSTNPKISTSMGNNCKGGHFKASCCTGKKGKDNCGKNC